MPNAYGADMAPMSDRPLRIVQWTTGNVARQTVLVNNHHVLHARRGYEDDRPAGRIRHLKRLWSETDLLSDEDKPEQFRLGRTDNWWASPGRTKSEVVV